MALYFHNKCAISTAENLPDPLAFFRAASMIQINGGEIFQKERADKGYRENRQRDSARIQVPEFLRVD
jgi:hypothetical protein